MGGEWGYGSIHSQKKPGKSKSSQTTDTTPVKKITTQGTTLGGVPVIFLLNAYDTYIYVKYILDTFELVLRTPPTPN